MKILFDHNLSPRLVRRLADLYPDASHVSLLGLERASDAEVWERARQGGYTIVTKDSDFNDLGILQGFPPKIIWLRLGNCTTQQIEDLLRQNHAALVAFGDDLSTGILLLS